jgi:hypothetical protein
LLLKQRYGKQQPQQSPSRTDSYYPLSNLSTKTQKLLPATLPEIEDPHFSISVPPFNSTLSHQTPTTEEYKMELLSPQFTPTGTFFLENH